MLGQTSGFCIEVEKADERYRSTSARASCATLIGGDGHRLDVPSSSRTSVAAIEDSVRVPALVPWLPFAWLSTLQRLHRALESRGVGFAVVQTVFEGAQENTFENCASISSSTAYLSPLVTTSRHRVHRSQRSWGLSYPGTPWFVVIDADGHIVFSDFHLDADRLVAELERA